LQTDNALKFQGTLHESLSSIFIKIGVCVLVADVVIRIMMIL
jgi:hypothetical protein